MSKTFPPKNLEALREDPETQEMVQQAQQSNTYGDSDTTGIRVSTAECVPVLKKHRRRKPGDSGKPGRWENYGETATRLLKYLDEKVWPIIHPDGDIAQK